MAKKIFFAFAALAVFAFASASFAQDRAPGAPNENSEAKKLDTDNEFDVQDNEFNEDNDGDCEGCKNNDKKVGECKCGWKCVAVRGCFGCIKYRMVRVCDCDDCKCSCCAPVCCKPCCCKVVRCCAPCCCKVVRCCAPVCCYKPCCVRVVRCCAPVCCTPCCCY